MDTLLLILIALVLLLIKFKAPHQRISGVLVIPSFPIIGNTLEVLNNPSQVFLKWRDYYNSSIFVIHLGSTPAVVVNSLKDVHKVWKQHPLSTNSRPTLHTFHKIVSKDQGPTIGSTPYGASYRKLRKNVSKHLCPLSLSQARETQILDAASCYILGKIVGECLAENKDRNLLRNIQGYVLRCAVLLTYGFDLDTEDHDKTLADLIIETENKIINLRSITSNYQDYLPFLKHRMFNFVFGKDAERNKILRDGYMELLHGKYQHAYSGKPNQEELPFLAKMHQDNSQSKLNIAETKSFCLTMVSAGLDNLALTFDHILGQLSFAETGSEIQDKLYEELMKLYDNDFDTAWANVAKKLDCMYALALIHEGLRSFTVLPMSLARTTTKPISLGGAFIPKNSIILMNAFAANHDQSVFKEPYRFLPERWLDESGVLLKGDAINHVTFGLGSRKCAGDYLSIKETYILLCRFILLYRVQKPSDSKWEMEKDHFISNTAPRATSFEPREFRYSLVFRQERRKMESL